jgi:hypothetical protein
MTGEHPPMKSASSPPLPIGSPAPRRGLNGRRIAIVLGLGVAFAALSLGIASLLNDPVGSPPAAASANPAPTPISPETFRDGLPPLAAILDRPFPDGLATAQPETAAEGLEKRLAARRTPQRLTELAVAYQRLDDPKRSIPLLREALSLDPTYMPARVSLIMAETGPGSAGITATVESMLELEREAPNNQFVVFNVAWAALYAVDEATTVRALRRAVALDEASYLGVIAAEFLNQGGLGTTTEP